MAAQFPAEPRAACRAERTAKLHDFENRDWTDAEVALAQAPWAAAPAVHTDGLVARPEHSVAAGYRAAPCPGQFAAWFFAVHAVVQLVPLAAQAVQPVRYVLEAE